MEEVDLGKAEDFAWRLHVTRRFVLACYLFHNQMMYDLKRS